MIEDLILIMLSYAIIIVMSIIIFAWLLGGFFYPFMKVKLSRGKKILVKIQKNTSTDWKTGEEVEGQLVFKYNKELKRISQYKEGIYRSFNLNIIDVDSETWGVLKRDYKGVSGHDPAKIDSLIERAIMRPDKRKTQEIIIIILLVVIGLGVVYIGYKLSFLEQTINTLKTVGGVNL